MILAQPGIRLRDLRSWEKRIRGRPDNGGDFEVGPRLIDTADRSLLMFDACSLQAGWLPPETSPQPHQGQVYSKPSSHFLVSLLHQHPPPETMRPATLVVTEDVIKEVVCPMRADPEHFQQNRKIQMGPLGQLACYHGCWTCMPCIASR
jgi:hypothetical protein